MQEDRGAEPVKEFRLEGIGLFVVGAVFLAALAGAFYLGRWVERRTGPTDLSTVAAGDEPGSAPPPEPVAVEDRSGFFDTVEGPGKEAEPERQAVQRTSPEAAAGPSAAAEAPPERDTASGPGEGGPHFVQVFAGRDRGSAETLARKLKDAGHRVRIAAEGGLYKVRVGGYAERADAEALAERLRAEGFPAAWVPRVE